VKRFVFSCFVAFWASVLSIWGYAALAAGAGDPPSPPAEDARTVSAGELARHDRADDCWMAIDGVVYDFTNYIPRHPTPPAVMTPWCGKDASEGWRTKGYGRPHSPAADALLPEYRVGRLEG
jgi:cytochrome b involved in lipid metabolism